MIFAPDMADLVLSEAKTQTRRPVRQRDGENLPCRYVVGHDYAVQRGRGGLALGRIRITDVTLVTVAGIDGLDARAEGFDSVDEFKERWLAMHGEWGGWCWRIVFTLVEGP